MKRHWIILTSTPVTQNDRARFGIPVFENAEAPFQILDLSALLHPHVAFDEATRWIDARVHRIRTWHELNLALMNAAQLPGEKIALDFVIGFSDFNLRTARVSYLLRKWKMRLWLVLLGTLPVEGASNERQPSLLQKAIREPQLVVPALLGRALRYMRRKTTLFAETERVFSTPGDATQQFVARYSLPEKSVVWLQSLDAVEIQRKAREPRSADLPERFAVFLDDGLIGHPDFQILNAGSLSPKVYFDQMQALFAAFEKRYGVPVLIAAHPKIPYAKMPDAWRGRIWLPGRTAELVVHAEFALGHCSTSLGFSVTLNRPLAILDPPVLQEIPLIARATQRIRDALGVPLVKVPSEVDALPTHPHEWTRDHFVAYREKYLVPPTAPETHPWEAVLHSIP